MMQEEQCLHELYQNLAYDVSIESLVVLSLDVCVDVHTEHFSDNALDRVYLTTWPRN